MGKYVRVRKASPSMFQKGSFRIVDPGRVGHTKLVVGRLKAGPHKGKTRVQAVLFERKRR